MKNSPLILTLLLSQTSFLLSDDKVGESLYMEANCQKCHNIGNNFDPKNNKVKNQFQLNNWVKSCDNFFDVGWFPQEQKSVVNYLNKSYYKLKN